ncbi:RrF2 family transcriptional regulator [Tichowtungia aerotolerans]|uniref:Rrf2 family transcriptional regulator n=1 Tax=Tichowtungia aerotolerans TaxID=2697043 RepID=A0A6P1M6V6_9BACT|nr:Rrf2 family transcriptional regulator [Tichowtungia aerotolerans]QHI69752.1 Rrf2 family transcriptional regulator [Tichowtungia aerotolerans]
MIVGTVPKQVEYALMALTEMQEANPGKLFPVRELCDRHQVPFDVMSKTMQRMVRVGLLRSVQGASGGYQLIRDLETVSLLDLMEAVSGPVAAVNCLKQCGCARSGQCIISSSMRRLNEKMSAVYAELTVAELVAEDDPVERAAS